MEENKTNLRDDLAGVKVVNHSINTAALVADEQTDGLGDGQHISHVFDGTVQAVTTLTDINRFGKVNDKSVLDNVAIDCSNELGETSCPLYPALVIESPGPGDSSTVPMLGAEEDVHDSVLGAPAMDNMAKEVSGM